MEKGCAEAICGRRVGTGARQQITKGPPLLVALSEEDVRRRPTLPPPLGGSTIGAGRLNFRVRDGSGCFPVAMAAVTLLPNFGWVNRGLRRASRCLSSCRVCLVLGSGREQLLFLCAVCPAHVTVFLVCMVGVGQALGLLVPVG